MGNKSKRLTDGEVARWVATFEINYMEDSPFKGIINLAEIYKLTIPQQRQVYDALPKSIRKKFQEGENNNDE